MAIDGGVPALDERSLLLYSLVAFIGYWLHDEDAANTRMQHPLIQSSLRLYAHLPPQSAGYIAVVSTRPLSRRSRIRQSRSHMSPFNRKGSCFSCELIPSCASLTQWHFKQLLIVAEALCRAASETSTDPSAACGEHRWSSAASTARQTVARLDGMLCTRGDEAENSSNKYESLKVASFAALLNLLITDFQATRGNHGAAMTQFCLLLVR